MISALTHRLLDIQHVQKLGSTHHEGGEDEHENGVKIITLAGSNTGATMRSEMDEKSSLQVQLNDQEAAATYVNSNFQAINNSIMLGGSYSTNDAGVHLDISEESEGHHHKHGKKGKKKRERKKQFDHEIREMISALTHRLLDLQHVQKPGSTDHEGSEDEHEHGVKIITLAGSNTEATMRSEIDEKLSFQVQLDDQEATVTYVNSNIQAINNSIMLGGSYSTNDPDVHVDISEESEGHHHKHGKKAKKKERESSKKKQPVFPTIRGELGVNQQDSQRV
ncbi:hypothetical protein F0562_007846 [Nyssa sinensis]|uniref:Uncharacterized protein n=1 Tax=Nyssa sinensis TaxID=561372 RepID=A0A5J5A777_9ASTE|nr:hypothetical protein F0562_007846 [Nyssa sinensis]